MTSVKYKIATNWVLTYLQPRHPDLVDAYLEAGKITESAIRDRHLKDEDLDILLSHVTPGKKILADEVGNMLGKLANVWLSARQALEDMGENEKPGIRK